MTVHVARPLRALVVAYDFPPHAAIGTMRTLRVVQRLAEEGWDVTVLTSDPATFRPGTPIDEALQTRVPAGVRVLRARSVRAFEGLKNIVRPARGVRGGQASTRARRPQSAEGIRAVQKGAIGRTIDLVDAALAIPDQESAWLFPAIARGLAHCRRHRPDVIYSSAPPWTGQLVARALSAAARRPWVADFRDPWSRAPWREHRPEFVRRVLVTLERQVVRHADAVLFVSDANRRDFEQHYPEIAARFHLIPNGCDPSEFEDLQRNGTSDTFVLLHAGSLYGGRNPLPLLRAVANAIRRGAIDPQRFRLRLLGQLTVPGMDVDAICRELGLGGVLECSARVPRHESVRQMVTASALLVVQTGHSMAVPGKLYEYFAAGRPILAMADEGETAQLVRGSGNGVVVPTGDAERIEAGLLEVMARAERGIIEVPRALYDGRVGAARTATILRSCATERRRSTTTVEATTDMPPSPGL